MMPPSLGQLMAHADALPSLPEIVHHLMSTLKDEGADVDTLAHHINADPAIVARLLAAANSSAFGVNTRIDSARQAFYYLGVNRVVNIIIATALIQRFDTRTADFDARLLWRHTMGVATCARVLAEQIDYDPEIAFTAGLLHDIGQVLMFTAAPNDYAHVLELRQKDVSSILSAEIEVFGYDHTAAGSLLAREWKLPWEIIEAIAAHHDPDSYNNTGSQLGDLIHLAEVLSHALDIGEQPNNRVPDLSERACANLGVSWPTFTGKFAEIEARYDGIRIALGI
jgi:putative nucleotidyltransferase with HDIG domain